ncbi:MAG: tetratricopeptide repeat protein [Verrucomicrobiota bacterium]|jgi:hypothetical protein
MGESLANFAAQCFLSAVFVGAAWVLAWRLTPEPDRPKSRRWLRDWSLKGLLLPFLLWAVMNLGVSWELQPFMPEIQAVQNKGGNWFPIYLRCLANGLFILSSYWAAVTLGWAVYRTSLGLQEQPRKNFKALCWTCFVGLLIPALVALLIGGWPVLGLAAAIILVPIAAYAPGILAPPKRPPLYTRAIGKMKFGKYTEAEWEIIRELENCEDDFEGWMMMAELYANHFQDLPEAEQTILEICAQPKVTPSQVALALHRLADWHLKLAGDPEAARRALQMLCDRCRGTHLARMAQLRLNQLPATREELREQQHGQAIPLPALGDQLDQAPALESELDRRKAAVLANLCVEKLTRAPNSVPAREKLARLFAEHLDKVDLALEQLGLLLEMPGQPDSQRAEWLALVAAWHLKYRRDEPAARKTLERLLRDFPKTPQALAARRRLQLVETQHQEQAAKSALRPKTIRLTDGGTSG